MRALVQNYGKIILAIMGVILMFVFALPTFRGMKPDDYGKVAVGHLAGRKVTSEDMRAAQAEIDILYQMFPFFQLPDRQTGAGRYTLTLNVLQAFGGDQQEWGQYWYLLSQDAKPYVTMSISDAELTDMLAEMGLTDANVDERLGVHGRNRLLPAVSQLEAIEAYLRMLMNQPRPISMAELAGDQELRKAQVAFITVDGTADWEKQPTPTEDQIKKQYELYKSIVRTPLPPDDAQGPGQLPPEVAGHHYPFGYKYPDRVRAEYLVLKRADLRTILKADPKVIDAATEAAYAYWKEHPEEFKNPTTQGVLSAAPAIKPWPEVSESLIDIQIDQRVDRQIAAIRQFIQDRTNAPWKKNPAAPVADWVKYPQMVEEIGKNPAFGGFKPEYVDTGKELLGVEQLSKLPGIGKAFFEMPLPGSANQRVRVPFPALATRVKELVEPDPKNLLGRLDLQKGPEGPALADKDGNVYIYRVTAVDKTHEPASLDDVKAQVVEDIKKQMAYEKRVKELKDALAKTPDVEALAKEITPPAVVVTPASFSRMDQNLPPEIQAVRDFVKTTFNLRPPAAPSGGTTKPAISSTLLENEDTLKCYAIDLKSMSPATGADFQRQLVQLFSEPDPALRTFLQSYLSLESIAARVKYVPVTPFAKTKGSRAGM